MKMLKNESMPFGQKESKTRFEITENIIKKMESIEICPASNKKEVHQFLLDEKIIEFSFSVFDRFCMHGKYYEEGDYAHVKGMETLLDDKYQIQLKIKFNHLVNWLKMKTSFVARTKALEILHNSKDTKEVMEVVKYWTTNFDKEAKRQYIETEQNITKTLRQLTDEELESIILESE